MVKVGALRGRNSGGSLSGWTERGGSHVHLVRVENCQGVKRKKPLEVPKFHMAADPHACAAPPAPAARAGWAGQAGWAAEQAEMAGQAAGWVGQTGQAGEEQDGQDGQDGHPLRQFGRESSFQEHCSHEPSGSQLMSPRGVRRSGGGAMTRCL